MVVTIRPMVGVYQCLLEIQFARVHYWVLYFAHLAHEPSKILSKPNAPTKIFSFDVLTKFGLCLFTCVCVWQEADFCPDRSCYAVPCIFLHIRTTQHNTACVVQMYLALIKHSWMGLFSSKNSKMKGLGQQLCDTISREWVEHKPYN